MARWQYQGLAEPVSTTAEVVFLDKWLPSYPNRLDRAKRFLDSGWFTSGLSVQQEVIDLSKWQPTYPVRLDRLKRIQPIDFTVYANEIVTLDKWLPTYPIRLDRSKSVFHSGWFSTNIAPIAVVETIYLDKWIPAYPVRLDRAKRIFCLDYTTIDAFFGEVPITPIVLLEAYYRRYLQDTSSVQTVGPPITLPVGTETDETTYLRRYLQDIL